MTQPLAGAVDISHGGGLRLAANTTPMLAAPKVLLVDDDPSCRLAFGQCIVSAGYRLIMACSGAGLTRVVADETPALVILDVEMPECDGWEALAELRRQGSTVPVIMLSGCEEVAHRIKGLREGADDFIVKGCDHGEFLARIHAALRRSTTMTTQPRWLRIGDVTIDLQGKQATRAGTPLALTRTEYRLLKLFAQHLGKLVPRELMLDRVWGYDHLPDTRTIDTHLWRLRKKIGAGNDSWLRNVSGAGYVLNCETGEPTPLPNLANLSVAVA